MKGNSPEGMSFPIQPKPEPLSAVDLLEMIEQMQKSEEKKRRMNNLKYWIIGGSILLAVVIHSFATRYYSIPRSGGYVLDRWTGTIHRGLVQ